VWGRGGDEDERPLIYVYTYIVCGHIYSGDGAELKTSVLLPRWL
jgi:hypothetical protein